MLTLILTQLLTLTLNLTLSLILTLTRIAVCGKNYPVRQIFHYTGRAVWTECDPSFSVTAVHILNEHFNSKFS